MIYSSVPPETTNFRVRPGMTASLVEAGWTILMEPTEQTYVLAWVGMTLSYNVRQSYPELKTSEQNSSDALIASMN
jgi:hypothetical protein